MRLSTAVNSILLAHASCYVPSVLCKKGRMGYDTATATATMVDDNGSNNNDERMLFASLLPTDYKYRRNYIAIIEPENFVTLFPNGGGIAEAFDGLNPSAMAKGKATQKFAGDGVGGGGDNARQLQGSSTILNEGKIYDPADIAIVNKFNGVEDNDIGLDIPRNPELVLNLPFPGGRQPKQPIPPGDSAFFYHGICVATSAFNDPKGFLLDTVLSHSCKLNICLGGGGFNCIAIYAGTSFIFNVGQQIRSPTILGLGMDKGNNRGNNLLLPLGTEESGPSLPPPFPATIIGGTGSFEGIEGTVDIATICGTTGPIIGIETRRQSSTLTQSSTLKFGLIVQTISINANMPLPAAP
ncbi:hypothetical protein FRACYDRAFT_254185 [Fragilariopsis cylindrus CCMP1102]|uniref:Uncharacterized protein n=1 Tax=Fragilariopsis cylindrus CCMP1102 TaxID=635003 RepID=A0A1E7EL76_9STRA|nr:hypothetical protein FRACYDRAFT_254185 [Fragilariopsis cylindrus CCMP1102]|eukprot:OEU06634.1 hypothetical protein FRACYDRAFT_254185 [Fragilariopsis cylindrus CCMP1102]